MLVVLADPSSDYVFREPLIDEFSQLHRPACNTGFFIAARGAINFQNVSDVASQMSSRCQENFLPEYGDQSFFNYLLYACRIDVQLISSLVCDVSSATWAPQHVVKDLGGELVYFRKAGADSPAGDICATVVTPAFLHWAGLDISPSMANLHLFLEDAFSAMGLPGRLLLIVRLFRIDFVGLFKNSSLVLKRLFVSCLQQR